MFRGDEREGQQLDETRLREPDGGEAHVRDALGVRGGARLIVDDDGALAPGARAVAAGAELDDAARLALGVLGWAGGGAGKGAGLLDGAAGGGGGGEAGPGTVVVPGPVRCSGDPVGSGRRRHLDPTVDDLLLELVDLVLDVVQLATVGGVADAVVRRGRLARRGGVLTEA